MSNQLPKELQLKKRHHYIWSYYLKNWATDRSVWYKTSRGKIAFDSTRGLARENNFYKISLLKEQDYKFCLSVIDCWKNNQFKDQLVGIVSDYYKQSSLLVRLNEIHQNQKSIAHLKKIFEHNSVEDFHADSEKRMKPILDALINGNGSILDSTDVALDFYHFVGHQLVKTKNFKNVMLSTLKLMLSQSERLNDVKHVSLLKKNAWLMNILYGTNISASFFFSRKNDNHFLIENKTKIPFVASDNPVINIHSSLKTLRGDEPPEFADFYYPISPKYAFMINNSLEYDHLKQEVSEADVDFLNGEIYRKRGNTIISNSEDSLRRILNGC